MGSLEDQSLLDLLRVREAAFGWNMTQTDLSGSTIKVTLEMPKTDTVPLPG